MGSSRSSQAGEKIFRQPEQVFPVFFEAQKNF